MLHDKDIREPLFEFLEEIYPVNRTIEEKRMGRSRADAVMVTPDSIYGIEIKSDADTYARLASQVKDYDLYFDYNFVVVGTSHALHIEEHVPEYWGIITVEYTEDSEQPEDSKQLQRIESMKESSKTKTIDFYMLRYPKKNPNVSWERKMSMLWRPEMAHIQELNGMHAYKQKSKLFVLMKILEKVPYDILQTQICAELMERDYSTISERIYEYRKANARPGKTVRRKKKRKKYKVLIK